MKKTVLNLSIGQYVCFGICLLLMAVIPIVRSHKIFGYELSDSETEATKPVSTIEAFDDGTMVINTAEIGKNIIGYGGPTPVEIVIADDKIDRINILQNSETAEFLNSVKRSGLLDKFQGLTLQEAAMANVDAVSGATYSSTAIIKNIKAGANYALYEGMPVAQQKTKAEKPDLKWYFTIAVILCGAVLPLILRNKRYRTIQLALNVAILGLWGGTFLSYSLMVSYLTNGMANIILIPSLLLLITAFIYPMFGHINHYCSWLCPYGAVQELAGKCFNKKIPISASVAKKLTALRQILWFVLMWLLWSGLWFDWMDYEPFAAFFFLDASPVVLGIAGGFLLLSLFVHRPYCRFVCPTGTLFKFAEGTK